MHFNQLHSVAEVDETWSTPCLRQQDSFGVIKEIDSQIRKTTCRSSRSPTQSVQKCPEQADCERQQQWSKSEKNSKSKKQMTWSSARCSLVSPTAKDTEDYWDNQNWLKNDCREGSPRTTHQEPGLSLHPLGNPWNREETREASQPCTRTMHSTEATTMLTAKPPCRTAPSVMWNKEVMQKPLC